MRSNFYKLVKGACPADDCPVFNCHVSGYLDRIRKNAVVPDDAIMSDMHISHQQAILPDYGLMFICCPTANGDPFADHSVVPDKAFCSLTRKFQVLRIRRYRCSGIDLHLRSYPLPVPNEGIGSAPSSVSYDNAFL